MSAASLITKKTLWDKGELQAYSSAFSAEYYRIFPNMNVGVI